MSAEQLLVGGIIGLVSGAGLVAFAWAEREKDLGRERRGCDRRPPAQVPSLRIFHRACEELVAKKGIDQVRLEEVIARAREIASASLEAGHRVGSDSNG